MPDPRMIGHAMRRRIGAESSHLEMAAKKPTVDDDVTNYVGWAQGEGKNPDDLSTLREHELGGHITRGRADRVADQYHGVDAQGWRQTAKRGY